MGPGLLSNLFGQLIFNVGELINTFPETSDEKQRKLEMWIHITTQINQLQKCTLYHVTHKVIHKFAEHEFLSQGQLGVPIDNTPGALERRAQYLTNNVLGCYPNSIKPYEKLQFLFGNIVECYKIISQKSIYKKNIFDLNIVMCSGYFNGIDLFILAIANPSLTRKCIQTGMSLFESAGRIWCNLVTRKKPLGVLKNVCPNCSGTIVLSMTQHELVDPMTNSCSIVLSRIEHELVEPKNLSVHHSVLPLMKKLMIREKLIIPKILDVDKRNEIYKAASVGTQALQNLLDAGYSMCTASTRGRTAFQKHVEYNNENAVRAFLDLGFKPDDFGFMPLICAIKLGNAKILKILLDAGINLNIVYQGKSIITYALEQLVDTMSGYHPICNLQSKIISCIELLCSHKPSIVTIKNLQFAEENAVAVKPILQNCIYDRIQHASEQGIEDVSGIAKSILQMNKLKQHIIELEAHLIALKGKTDVQIEEWLNK